MSTFRPELEHHPFHLEHRLFNDTSSQLLNTPNRAYTHLLSSSHDASAFLASTPPSASTPSLDSFEIITIPKADFDGFGLLIVQRMQPLWYSRMNSIVDGIHVRLEIKGKTFELRIGEVKVKGASRGTLIEIYYDRAVDGTSEQIEAACRGILNELLRAVFDFTPMKIFSTKTLERVDDGEKTGTDWNLAKLYMQALTPGRATGTT